MKKLSTLLLLWCISLTSQAAVNSITSGRYYRMTNASYTTLSMTETGNKVSGIATDATAYAQMWKITQSGTYYTLQNALTGNYIQGNPGVSKQWETGATAHNFAATTSSENGNTVFAFSDPEATYYPQYAYLHCAATQGYTVVGWLNDGTPSRWTLEEVALTSDELAEIADIQAQLSQAGSYTTILSRFFSDYACTKLKSTYQNYSDDQLRTAMSSLPKALQEMAVRVKNDTWNSDATWNVYEKDFRIHAYDIFSNSVLWAQRTQTGPFAHLFHPTGIQAHSGDIIYLFVDSNVKNTNASLEAECVIGTDRKGAAQTLKRGCNAIYVTSDCEIFVSYLLNDTTLSCNDYPDIKVHIEGGTCNGCFDMRGHGHKNSDWAWLKQNMFKNKYLHVKGNSTLLNCVRERVIGESNAEGVLGIWDYVFDTEESLCGNDKWKATGRYKMMVNNFDNEAGGDPYWSNGNYGYSQPGIWSTGVFNYNLLSNVATNGGQIWVMEHELGHGHQTPINMAGTTEASNNSLAQAVNFLTAGSGLFQTSRSSRADGVKTMISRFNSGYSWIDFAAQRSSNDIWAANRWLFQLWLYFDGMRKYKPDTNEGFSFMADLYDAMRADPIKKSSNPDQPAKATDDYLKLARHCARLTQTDLSEFFEAWGFWQTTPTVSNSNDRPENSTWFFSDYGNYYLQTSQEMVDEVRNYMRTLPGKGGNLMFIEDRCTGSTLPTYDNSSPSSFGETGYYQTYDQPISGNYVISFSGNKVTLTGGTGAVGFKVYDADGKLVALANTNSFTLSATIVAGLMNGTHRLVAAQGDGQDVEALPANGLSVKVYEDFTPYFYQNVGQYFALSQACYDEWFPTFQKCLLSCTADEYNELKAAIQAGIRYPQTGKFRIKSSGSRLIGESYIGYGSPQIGGMPDGLITIAAAYAQANVSTVLTLTETGETSAYYMATQGRNVLNQTTLNQPFPATTTGMGDIFLFQPMTPGVVAITCDETEQGYFHESNADGWNPLVPAVVRWTKSEEASHWTVEDAYDRGDVNQDNAITIADVTALVNIILGKNDTDSPAYNHREADVNQDGLVTIADVTALVNIILGKSN